MCMITVGVATVSTLYMLHRSIKYRIEVYNNSVPARLGKGQGAKEIGHNLARERPKFGHNLVHKRHKIGHTFMRERPKFGLVDD